MNNRCLCVRRRCRDGQEDDAASAASRLQSGVPAFRQQQWQLADSVVPLLALWISFWFSVAVERADRILLKQGFISWRTRSSPEVLFIFQVLCKESPEQWINWQERLKSKQCFLHSCVLRDAKDEEMAVFSRGHSGTAASWQQKHELFSNIWWLMFLTSWECRGVWDFSFQWGFRTRCARPYPKSRIVFIFQVERESECKLVRWKGNQSAIALERFVFGFGFHNI